MANETAKKTLKTRIKLKRDTSAKWESANPILLNGEKIIVDTANGETREKIGDGVKTYSQLPFTDEKIRGMITGKADSIELERIKYYGDKDIIPSPESYFVVNTDGDTITGLTEEGKTQTELVVPYEINGKKIVSIEGSAGVPVFVRTEKVILPKSIRSVGQFAFLLCTTLTSINLENVHYIGQFAFQDCTSLTSIDISNVGYFDQKAFDGCTSLVSVGKTAIYVGIGTFSRCTSLTSVNISNHVTTISNGAFSGCTSLKSIDIPNSVTSIENSAFYGCTSLTSVEIPNSVTVIEEGAFSGCTSLTSVEIPSSVKSIVSENEFTKGSFSGCTSLTIYCEQGSYAETYAKENSIPVVYTDISDILTKGEFERIKYYGDKDVIPSPESYFVVNTDGDTITGLTDIGKSAVTGGVTELVFPYEINGKKITKLYNPRGENGSILEGVESKITNIVLPNSITDIGGCVFYECSALKSISFSNKIEQIEEEAFYGCTSLTSIDIPNSVRSICADAFENCTSLTSINLPNEVFINSHAFYGCPNATIYCGQGSYAEFYAKQENIPVTYTSGYTFATGSAKTIEVPVAGWTTETDNKDKTYFMNIINKAGLTADGYVLCDVVLENEDAPEPYIMTDIANVQAQKEAYMCVDRIFVGDGSISLYCFDEKPSVSFTIRILIMDNLY